MSQPPEYVRTIQRIRDASQKNTLVLEGRFDLDVCQIWLARIAGTLVAALGKLDLIGLGGKLEVLNALAWFRDQGGNPGNLFGLVDRDEWDAATISSRTTSLPQLRVNPQRHSLESYFCDPAEIRPVLGAQTPALDRTRLNSLVSQMRKALSDRVDHWCLFTVTERVKNRMSEAQFPGIFHDQYVLPFDREVKKRLKTWASIVKAEAIFAEFVQLRSESRTRPASERFRACVWAKPFYEQVVYGGPSGLQSLRNTSSHTWMLDLATNMKVPDDLVSILTECLT
jgi:hypothetical protein